MKKIIIAILPLVFFSFCKCKTATNSPISWNVTTLAVDGKAYSDTFGVQKHGGVVVTQEHAEAIADSQQHYKEDVCVLSKSGSGSVFNWSHNATATCPYSINVVNAAGPAAGVGMFKISKDDMVKRGLDANNPDEPASTKMAYISLPGDTQRYPVDSMNIRIISAAGSSIDAEYEIWAANSSITKDIKGRIVWHAANIKQL